MFRWRFDFTVLGSTEMSRGRKSREGTTTPPAEGHNPASSTVGTVPKPAPSGVLLQLLAILGLSCALGFTFNAASPLGVRFGEPAAVPTPAPKVAPQTPLVAKTNPPAPLPSLVNSNKLTTIARPAKPVTAVVPSPLPVTSGVSSNKPASNALPAAAAKLPVFTPMAGQTNPAPIHWVEAKALVAASNAVLVDVRHKAMYDAGHIPGAFSLPEWSPPEEFKNFLAQQATNLAIIVYCSSTSCSQSARVANRLVNEFHWPAVRYMTGGYMEYQQAEVAKPAAAPTAPRP
jgi:rhodanese-related sulfurtransferase